MIGDGVAHELVVIAQKLVDDDPEATFSDLLKLYFKHITGQEYDAVLDNPPDDEKIVSYHLDGHRIAEIAAILNDDSDYIKWVLLVLGFSPNKNTTDEERSMERAQYKRLVDDGILG
jgi:hypothetical protein